VLPNFLHAGAAKAASSWLWRVCKEHPDIYVPKTHDNVNFFTVAYYRGLEWYERTYFGDFDGESAVGEFSNSYMCHEPALERIARDLPEVKLTVTLRNSVERLYLQWAHESLKRKNPSRRNHVPLERILHHHGHGYFRMWADPGFYARHLRSIYRYFPAGRVLVMIYDDLCDDPRAFLRRFLAFLAVDDSFQPSVLTDDINPDPPDDPETHMPPELRAQLRLMYRDDIAALSEMLDRDLSAWG